MYLLTVCRVRPVFSAISFIDRSLGAFFTVFLIVCFWFDIFTHRFNVKVYKHCVRIQS